MHIDHPEFYRRESVPLSVSAKLAISLLMFQKFCLVNRVEGRIIDDFQAHLWIWLDPDKDEDFDEWEQSRTELINFGLGDAATPELSLIINASKIEEFQFRKVVESIVDILWGNFWGACDHEMTTNAFETVLSSCKLDKNPPITPFKFSRFSDNSGWGSDLTPEDFTYWKNCFRDA